MFRAIAALRQRGLTLVGISLEELGAALGSRRSSSARAHRRHRSRAVLSRDLLLQGVGRSPADENSNGISGSSNPWKATFHRAVLQWSMSITVKAQMLILDFDINWGYRASKMRAKNPTDQELVLRARYTCCGCAKEEQDAWNTRLLGRGRSVLSVHARRKHGEAALLRPRSAKGTECHRALVRL